MKFNNKYMSCIINLIKDNKLSIKGVLNNRLEYKNVVLIAAKHMDRLSNYSGSGLPFPCYEIAFENTPNKYNVDNSGNIDTIFTYPNSYYSQTGNKKINSSVFVILTKMDESKEFIRLELEDICPLKTLVNRENRKGPEFYASKDYLLPVATAENTMYNYAKLKLVKDIA
jgi:hypothetical protein